MKTLKCDLCEHKTQGETFEAWMEALTDLHPTPVQYGML